METRAKIQWFLSRHLLVGLLVGLAVCFFATATVAARSAVYWNNQGVEHLNKGDNEAAVRDFSEALDIDPEMALAWFHRGLGYSRQERLKKAITDFSRAII